MKILILEGISTSGKSCLIKKLSELLIKQKILIFGEPMTHIPIMNKPNELHVGFFRTLISVAVKADANAVIFDRLHFTQAFRAKADIAHYAEIERLLMKQDTFVAYLKVDDNAIAERVRLAAEHRDKEWGDYIYTKGKTMDEIAEYYITQQRSQLELLTQTKLINQVFNTTQHNYQEIAKKIIEIVME
ncbi:MAG: hypothetical protein NVSMB46_07070 [Candidatus Saccharimonadales bacterium]